MTQRVGSVCVGLVMVLALGAVAGCQTSADSEFANRPVSEWPSQQALRSIND